MSGPSRPCDDAAVARTSTRPEPVSVHPEPTTLGCKCCGAMVRHREPCAWCSTQCSTCTEREPEPGFLDSLDDE